VLAALTACDGADGGEKREWTAADHDQPASNQAPQVSARSSAGHAPGADMSLIDLAWRRNCEKCHGPRGRGDGPEGPMVKAPDLTRAEWQAKVTDDEMAELIRKGKNKMPGFEAALPAQVIDGLVRRIRAARARTDDPARPGGG